MSGKVVLGVDLSDGWETTAVGVMENGVLTILDISQRFHGDAIEGTASRQAPSKPISPPQARDTSPLE
jgi:hypothetical protein